MGFELTVRSEKFAFDFSIEFPASFVKFGVREKFAPEVLYENYSPRLRGPVSMRSRRCGSVCSNEAAMRAPANGAVCSVALVGNSQCLRESGRSMEPALSLN